MVSMQGELVRLDQVQMQLAPLSLPPIYLGAMREKTLQLAGQVGDGIILTGMSSPDYVRWASDQIQRGMAESNRSEPRLVVFHDVKVSQDGETARAAVRSALASRFPWADVQVNAAGIAEELPAFLRENGTDSLALHMPDAWLDAFSSSGTPDQAADGIQRLFDAGADAVVLQPLDGDPACLDEYAAWLMPLLRF